MNKKEDTRKYKRKARKLKNVYFKNFYNPDTGVLAGWKSKDGELHDYYFLFVNSMAIYYNLVPEKYQRIIMQTFLSKLEEVGFNNFRLGLPGNLIPIKKGDYVEYRKRYGAPVNEDGSDSFQIYENGGASLNWSYYTIEALKISGFKEKSESIMKDFLYSIDKGDFQGYCNNNMTKDWKKWNGECWGYEGFLCDGYLVLLALNPNDG